MEMRRAFFLFSCRIVSFFFGTRTIITPFFIVDSIAPSSTSSGN